MDDFGRHNDPAKSLTDRIESALYETHTALPGRILSYDATKQRARVQLQIKRRFAPPGEVEQELLIAPLLEVPVLFPRAGGYAITFPVAVNDPCLVLFAERDIRGWLENGAAAAPPTARHHDYSDGVAILGLFPGPNALSPAPSTSAMAMRNAANTKKIEISSSGIVIDSDSDVSVAAGDDVALTPSGDLSVSAGGAVSIATAGGAITISDGTSELLFLLSDALNQIGTSTVGGLPLSNAAAIAAIKALVDAMRT